MASTFSPLLRIELIGAGEQSGAWNNTTNTNLGTLLEQAIAGATTVTLSGATYDLGGSAAIANGASDIQRNIAISFNGTPGADAVITIPATSKIYFIKNDTTGGFSLKLKTSAQLLANAIVVPNGRTMIVGCDGTNAVPGINSLPVGSTISSDVISTVSGTETLTNKTLTAPKFADNGFISDASANQLLAFDTLASGLLAAGNASLSISNGPALLVTTGASGNGTTATITYTAENSTQIPVGAVVTVAGVSPTGYNGTYVVTASAVGSVSFANTTTAAYVSAGTVSVAPVIAATGTGTNIDINLIPKGTGSVRTDKAIIQGVGSETALAVNHTGTGAALTISQTGSGNALLIEDETSPDPTPFVVSASGNVGIGTSAPTSPLQLYNATNSILYIQGDATSQAVVQRSSTDTVQPVVAIRKTRGTSAAPTAVASGDLLGTVLFQGFGGTNVRGLAAVNSIVETYTSDTNISAALTLATSPSGSSGTVERFRIGSAGQLGIGGTNYGTAGQVLTSGGTSAAPSWATPSSLVRGTAIATTSGTSHDFSSIPSGVRVITLMLSGVSTNGVGNVVLQLGSSGTPLASGYLGTYAEWQNGGNAGLSNFSTSFIITGTSAAGTTRHGAVTLTNLSGNIWTMTFTVSRGDSTFIYMGSGSVTLSGTLDIIRLSSTSTFDAGSINILYQ